MSKVVDTVQVSVTAFNLILTVVERLKKLNAEGLSIPELAEIEQLTKDVEALEVLKTS